MLKSLKHTPEPDTFDFGKAVTLILSQVKELNKTRNTLVDEISYMEARKKQETAALERTIAEKAEVLKIKGEVTEKIIAQKAEFTDLIAIKKQELATKEADLRARETNLADSTKKSLDSIANSKNDLEIRSNEFKKQKQNSLEALNQRENALIAREEVVTAVTNQNSDEKIELDGIRNELKVLETSLHESDAARANKKLELENREAALINKETELDKQRQNLANLASDLENQASLIERERNKNKSDAEMLRTLTKNIKDKKLELDTREIHLKDREATALSHGNVR